MYLALCQLVCWQFLHQEEVHKGDNDQEAI